ncbi:hypothetical protein LXL04_028591 [Taraxacum kok-saghyz]
MLQDAQDLGISIELLLLSTPNEEFNVSYGDLYAESGFQPVLQVPYRSFLEQVEPPKETAAGLKVEAPALFIMGEEDYVFKFPGMEEYLKSGEVMKYVPNLEIMYLPEGSHFVHE